MIIPPASALKCATLEAVHTIQMIPPKTNEVSDRRLECSDGLFNNKEQQQRANNVKDRRKGRFCSKLQVLMIQY